jgi:nucleoside-triphosphatase THEP1
VIIDILTGQVQSGKTRLLQKITLELKQKGIVVGGYLSLSVYEKGQLIGYDLYDLKKETKHSFLRKQGQGNWEKIGPYSFLPGTLKQAKNTILQTDKIDICFLDEVGPYELEGKGLWPALAVILGHPTPGLFLTVRENILDAFLERLGKNVDKIFDVTDEDVHPRITAHLEKKAVR